MPRPDLDTHVFCRPVQNIGNFEVDGCAARVSEAKRSRALQCAREWSCVATAEGVPKHACAGSQSTQLGVLAHPLTQEQQQQGTEQAQPALTYPEKPPAVLK